ncbi:MAG: DUF58 domain-containing protein [Kangiellaceae bacterium]|nr:DUF58 domain-containing protein [Kangiellaceae bacterium]
MANWSNLSHQFESASADYDDPDFKPGIDLTLNQLLETRVKPIIQWLAPDSMVKTNRVGGFRSRFKGRGMDFDEVRMYQIGDDIRNIDWKVTARTGEAHTKLFKEERERPVFVVLDHMPNMFFGTTKAFKSIIASHIAGQLMWHTLANGDRFGALLFDDTAHFEMKPSGNRRNCMRLLNKIVENYQQSLQRCFSDNPESATKKTAQLESSIEKTSEDSSTNQLKETLKRLRYLAKPGSLIHIVSDFSQFDESCERQLSQLSQHADVHCVFISDPIESQLPPEGLYGITDGSSLGLLNTSQPKLREAYQNAFEQKVNRVKDFAISHRGVFTYIDTSYAQYSIGQQGAAVSPSQLKPESGSTKSQHKEFNQRAAR